MSAKFDWSQFESANASDKSKASSIDWSQFESGEEKPGKFKSGANALLKGLIKGGGDITSLVAPYVPGAPSPELIKNVTEQNFKSLPEHSSVERVGRLIPQVLAGEETLPLKLAQLGLSVAGGELAENSGFGETGQGIGEGIGMGLPGLVKGGVNAVKKGIQNFKNVPAEKLPSGLSKPKALEAKHAEKALITSERQKASLERLDKQASELTKESVKKHLPISKQIEEGFDFEGKFEKEFGNLTKAAENANPTIDITPISEFLSETNKKYKGIPTLHPEAQKIIKEVKALRNKPQLELKNLLKIYRSNNKKVKNIYETSRLTGRQQEYVDFLGDLNKSIAKSFENTLPADSAWVKQFKDLNAGYKQYKDSLSTMKNLESLLNQKATPATLERFAENKKLQDKLALSMGEKGKDEIVQIAKDTKAAKEAIKRIPIKEYSLYDKVIPLTVFIPGIGKIVAISGGLVKSAEHARRIQGYLLSSPKGRKAYGEALKALKAGDLEDYRKVATKILTDINKKEEE